MKKQDISTIINTYNNLKEIQKSIQYDIKKIDEDIQYSAHRKDFLSSQESAIQNKISDTTLTINNKFFDDFLKEKSHFFIFKNFYFFNETRKGREILKEHYIENFSEPGLYFTSEDFYFHNELSLLSLPNIKMSAISSIDNLSYSFEEAKFIGFISESNAKQELFFKGLFYVYNKNEYNYSIYESQFSFFNNKVIIFDKITN